MKTKKTLFDIVFDIANAILMILLMVIAAYPFIHILNASLSDTLAVSANKGLFLWPKGFNFKAYKMVFDNPMILTGYENTLIYVVCGTALNMIMTLFGAYGLSRKNVAGTNLIMFMIVFTMFFSGGLIPMYILIKTLGWINSPLALIVPGAVSAYNLIIMRTSFKGIPDSIEESAKMDGANDFIILFKIMIPLSLPIIAVMVLFYGVGHWNAYFSAMIYLNQRERYPLQLVLREILIQNNTDNMMTDASSDKALISETIKYATIIVSTLPILVVYPFLQKYFTKGVMIGAIKE